MVALLYLATAAALLSIVGRWIVPLSRRDALVLALLPLVESGEALVRGRVLAPIDLPWNEAPLAAYRAQFGVESVSSGVLFDLWTQIVPWQKAVRAALAAGEWPLWNPFILGGEPLLASYQPAVVHPIHLVSLLCPLALALTFVIATTLLCSATFFFALSRELGVRSDFALVGAAFWSYSAFHLFWLGWPVTLGAAGVPLLLLGVVRAFRAGESPLGCLVAGAVWVLLAGNPEVAAVAGALAGALALTLAVRRVSGGGGRRLARCALAAAIALGLSAVQLWPFLDALPQTAEYSKRSFENEELEVRGNWRQVGAALAQTVVPLTLVTPGGRLGIPSEIGRANGWIGGVGMVLALVGLVGTRTRVSWFFALAAFVGWGLAARLPGLIQAWEAIPVLDLVKPRYGHLIAALGFSALAAFGLEAAVERSGRRLAALFAGAALAYAAAFAAGGRFLATGIAVPRIALGAAAVVVPLALAAWIFRRPRAAAQVALVVLCATLAEREIEMGELHLSFPRSIYFPEPVARGLLPERAEPFRIVALGSALPPNIATLWGLEDVRGYDPMALGRLVETRHLWARTPSRWLRSVDTLTPFHTLLGVRFALSPVELEVKDAWRSIGARSGLFVYENDEALSRFFVPRRVVSGSTPAERLEDLALRRDFLERAWLEPEDGEESQDTRGGENGPCTVGIEGGGSRYRLRLDCFRDSWLASSIPAWRGWRAVSDARDLPLGVVNHAFLALRVPRGASEIELSYRPRAFAFGAALSALVAAALVAARLVASRRRAR